VIHNGFEDGERVRLVVPFTGGSGVRYEVGWTGSIFPFSTTLAQSREADQYEVNLDDDGAGGDRGVVTVSSAYLERVSEVREEGELRQGDRVKLVTGLRGDRSWHEVDQIGTVLAARVRPGSVSHDVAFDFDENVAVPLESLERIPDRWARVIWLDDGGVEVSFGDGKAF
jgi:hypothetical protein